MWCFLLKGRIKNIWLGSIKVNNYHTYLLNISNMTTHTLKKPSVKASITIKQNLFNKLERFNNKSKIINEALDIYFAREEYLKKAEEDFWNEKIRLGLQDVENWNTIKINPNWEEITDELIKKALWS